MQDLDHLVAVAVAAVDASALQARKIQEKAVVVVLVDLVAEKMDH
jgi:hypothetical protein